MACGERWRGQAGWSLFALSIPVLTDNGDLGGGVTIQPGQRLFLLIVAAFLLAVQTLAFLIHREKR